MRSIRLLTGLLIPLFVLTGAVGAWAENGKGVNDYLSEGALGAGISDYASRLKQPGATDGERFSLATLTFFQSIQGLAQSFYRVGLDSGVGRRANLPLLRLPVPRNPHPEAVTGRAVREILEQFEAGLEASNRILLDLQGDPFSVPVDVGHIRLDIDGDGRFTDGEMFSSIYTAYNRRAQRHFTDKAPLTIHFDAGDAYWLKGYTHLLLAITNALLAHDGSRVFHQAGHVFFPKADTEQGALFRQQAPTRFSPWADLIAGVHVMNMKVRSRKRMRAAHAHLLEMIAASRRSWQLIAAEGDDDLEWLPNRNQTSVTGVELSAEMIAGWLAVLDELEDILQGRKLVPHWRITDGRGINLKRVLLEPEPFDLVLWVQGAAAVPYLEHGHLSSKRTWRRLTRVFRGDFIGFAVWIN